MLTKSKPLDIALLLVLLAAVVMFLLRAFSVPATTDSGTFSAIALHMLHGKRLYADVWDNKPPGIFLMYKWAFICFGKSWQAIHGLLVVLNLAMFASLYFGLKKLLNSAIIALFICLGFSLVYFDVSLYSTGGLTEEFGIIFLILGSSLVVLYQKKQWVLLLGAGLISFAPWFKEPFVFISAVVLFYLFWRFYKDTRTGFLMLAMALPHLLMIFWLVYVGVLDDYIQTLSRNVAYTKNDGGLAFSFGKNSHLLTTYYWNTNYVLCTAVIVALFFMFKEMLVKRQVMSLLFFLLLGAVSVYAVFMSAKGFGHYFQMGTYFLLLSTGYVFWYLIQKSKIPIYSISKWTLVALIGVVLVNYFSTTQFVWNYKNHNQNRITDYIKNKKQKGDRIFVESQNLGALYLETGLISEVPMPVAFNVHVQTQWGLEMVKKQDSILRARPHRFVIQNKQWIASTGYFGTRNAFKEDYKVIDSMQSSHTDDFYYLLERK